MTAPVVGFTAEVPNGLHGETYIEIAPDDDDWAVPVIGITISRDDSLSGSHRTLIVTHDEARQIIAGLASVIT